MSCKASLAASSSSTSTSHLVPGGLRVELVPIRLHTVPGAAATFACSYRAHQNLTIAFHLLRLGGRQDGAPVAGERGRREAGGGYSWRAVRQWSLVVPAGQAVVVCTLADAAGRAVGRLQALVTTAAEHSPECAVGECSALRAPPVGNPGLLTLTCLS